MKKFLLILILLFFLLPSFAYSAEESLSEEEIMQSQQDSLDINSFIEEADKYTEDVYADIDIGELFSSVISGNIDNETIIKSILNAVRRRSIRCNSSTWKYISNHCNT